MSESFEVQRGQQQRQIGQPPLVEGAVTRCVRSALPIAPLGFGWQQQAQRINPPFWKLVPHEEGTLFRCHQNKLPAPPPGCEWQRQPEEVDPPLWKAVDAFRSARAEIDSLEDSESEIRPSAQAVIDLVASAAEIGLPVHTTRGMAPPIPEFRAGRFGVPITCVSGERLYVVFQTESLVGHLGRVVVGATPVDGSVSVTDSDYRGSHLTLNRSELGALVTAMIVKNSESYSTPLSELIKFGSAIYANGAGAATLIPLYTAANVPIPQWITSPPPEGPPHRPGMRRGF
jgi:hypothetical protein